MLKCCVIFYHSNIASIYKQSWIDKCVDSIKKQTLKNFHVFELNYNGSKEQYCKDIRVGYDFISTKFSNHIEALNYLHGRAFAQGFDVVFNVNLDDFYRHDRLEKQLHYINEGYQLVSSDFCYIDSEGEIFKVLNFSSRDIEKELNKNHNVIAHPCTAMHRSFWDDHLHYNTDLLGREDLDLWKRGVKAGKKFFIAPENLLFYRIHSNQVTKKHPK